MNNITENNPKTKEKDDAKKTDKKRKKEWTWEDKMWYDDEYDYF